MKLPGAEGRSGARSWPTSASPRRCSSYIALTPPLRRARHRSARCAGSGIELPAARHATRTSCGTTGSATSTRTCSRTARSRAPSTARRCVITGASSGIGRAAALKIAAAGGIPLLVARTQEKLEEVKAEIEAAGGTAYVVPVRPVATTTRSTQLVEQAARRPRRAIDMLVNNAGRSIRRSVALSYDRFHDYERTIQLNYLGPVKLMLGLLPHMREQRRRPHRQRLLDRRADEPAALPRLRRPPRRRSTRSRAW